MIDQQSVKYELEGTIVHPGYELQKAWPNVDVYVPPLAVNSAVLGVLLLTYTAFSTLDEWVGRLKGVWSSRRYRRQRAYRPGVPSN
ncbi:MAG: hypothetical protein ACXV6K_09845 [Halobacteriota archaeon]